MWPVAIAALIFFASSRSQIAGPPMEGSDKVGHFLVYGLFGTLMVRLGRGWRAALVAVVIASAYGVTDEFHQSFVPGRSVEVADWLADTSGAALAVALYAFWPRYRRLLEMRLWGKQPRVEKPAAVATVSPS